MTPNLGEIDDLKAFDSLQMNEYVAARAGTWMKLVLEAAAAVAYWVHPRPEKQTGSGWG